MLINVYGAKCIGIDAVKVTVEVNIDRGIGIHLVGLADVAVKESLLRTTTALQSLGFRIPGKKIVINLAPADLHKSGSGYDLPIAVGIIAASEQKTLPGVDKYIMMGELGLDGQLRPVPGALPLSEMARDGGFRGIILPEESALEASELKDIMVYGVKNLGDVMRILEEREGCEDLEVWNLKIFRDAVASALHPEDGGAQVDFEDIIGQQGAKRAMEIAAAGGHNVILIGAPGSGKSSLAKALPGIMPPMTTEEASVTSRIYSIAGRSLGTAGLMRSRPYRAPHYSATLAAIVGGGSGDAIVPGEVSLAHNGVLFLDEFGQMPRSVIEALRAPMEDRSVCISRLRTKVTFPASFMLVAASNPCPCGYWGEGDRCTCTPSQRLNYLSKLSGPVMDRIDLQCWMHTVDSGKIIGAKKGEPSSAVAARVLKARVIQQKRFEGEGIGCNAQMDNRQIGRFCPLDEACTQTLQTLLSRTGLSLRAYFRIIKVARTIADLEGAEHILPAHIMEAAGFRFLDKRLE